MSSNKSMQLLTYVSCNNVFGCNLTMAKASIVFDIIYNTFCKNHRCINCGIGRIYNEKMGCLLRIVEDLYILKGVH